MHIFQWYYKMKYSFCNLFNFMQKMVVTQKQPLGLAKSVKLYKYQLDAVNWMKSVEEDAQVGTE